MILKLSEKFSHFFLISNELLQKVAGEGMKHTRMEGWNKEKWKWKEEQGKEQGQGAGVQMAQIETNIIS